MAHDNPKNPPQGRISHELYDHIREAAKLLKIELEKARDREKRLERALNQVFPFALYKKIRPDSTNFLNGSEKDILEHYVDFGINESDLRYNILKYKNFVSLKVSEGCLRDVGISTNAEVKPISAKKKRELIKTKGNNVDLNTNENHMRALIHTCIHYESNTLCTWIPKNGCSNLRYTLARANGAIVSIEELSWIHNNNSSFSANSKEVLLADYSFVFLRNPFKRLLSFFTDKICHSAINPIEDLSYAFAKKVFNSDDDTSFSDFINFIWENPFLIYDDIHTRPQSDFMVLTDYDDYFSLENYLYGTNKILEKTGLDIIDVRENNTIFTTKNCEDNSKIMHSTKSHEIRELMSCKQKAIPENMYTNDMIKKVASIYLQDIYLYASRIKDSDSELQHWILRSL